MDLEQLIERAKQGDLDAFAEVTRRFQHMAFGYALSIVRDLQQAEDVVQEAFVAAWFGLITLADPAAFPGWFRGIVRHQAYRLVRQRHLEALPLAAADAVAAEGSQPDDRLAQGQQVATVLSAIARLPVPLREIVTLFYVHDCTQQDIATFLGLAVTTVNNRLHAARTQLKRRTLTMVKDTLEEHRLPDDFAARIGRIVRSREGVVEVLFDPTKLPDPLTELTVSDEGRRRAVTVQVVQLLENGVVRCVPMSPVEGLSPGMTVLNSGHRTQAPVSPEALDGAVRLLTKPVREPNRPPEVLETGIKVIDVMCPLVRGGTVALAGEYGVGTTVVVEELCRRLNGDTGGVSIFTFIPPGPDIAFQEEWTKEGWTGGTAGTVQTFYFVGEQVWTVERLSALPSVDVVICLSKELARLRIYPTIDAIFSRSQLLDEELVDRDHVEVAAQVREALTVCFAETTGPGAVFAAKNPLSQRARKLLRFFAQPFFVAEPYTKQHGLHVSRKDALRGCRAILSGECDAVPEKAFSFTGTLEDVLRKARLG
jgi:RNA polymerase sigma factor (sigma-70 family)